MVQARYLELDRSTQLPLSPWWNVKTKKTWAWHWFRLMSCT